MRVEDAAFMLELLNGAAWLRHIGDRGVKTLDDAQGYIRNGPLQMYARLGFGSYVVESKDTGAAIGTCGLLKRDFLDDVDIGYALLPQHCGRGYASEAASALLCYARDVVGKSRVLATVRAANVDSVRVLEKLGLRFERAMMHPDGDREIQVYAIDFTQ